jgi:hypothetical protein
MTVSAKDLIVKLVIGAQDKASPVLDKVRGASGLKMNMSLVFAAKEVFHLVCPMKGFSFNSGKVSSRHARTFP